MVDGEKVKTAADEKSKEVGQGERQGQWVERDLVMTTQKYEGSD